MISAGTLEDFDWSLRMVMGSDQLSTLRQPLLLLSLTADIARNRTCEDCQKGTKQPDQGTTECLNCIPGRYQTNEKQSTCIDCEAGRASAAVAHGIVCQVLCFKINRCMFQTIVGENDVRQIYYI